MKVIAVLIIILGRFTIFTWCNLRYWCYDVFANWFDCMKAGQEGFEIGYEEAIERKKQRNEIEN